MTNDQKLVELGAAWLLAAEEAETGEATAELIDWARRALGFGEDLVHDGDCTKQAHPCRLCQQEHYTSLMRTALNAINASGTHAIHRVAGRVDLTARCRQ